MVSITLMPMRLLRLIPLYASALLLAVAVALVADSRDWSPIQLALAGLVVAVVYLAAVAVPYLLNEMSQPMDKPGEFVYARVAIGPNPGIDQSYSNGHGHNSIATGGGATTRVSGVKVA
jgi:hypothetical protein